MSALPRIGLIAGHGVDVQAWKDKVNLPGSFDWRIIKNTNDVSPLDLDGLVWLWQPSIPSELLRTERQFMYRWCRSVVSSRRNELIPLLVVAVDSFQKLDEENQKRCVDWLKSVERMIGHVYQYELKNWVPEAMADASRIALQADTAEGGSRLAEAIQRQRTTITLWQRGIRRPAERSLVIGLLVVALYLVAMLLTIPWTPSAKPIVRTSEPVAWSRAEWQYHIKDCKLLLESMKDRPLDKLTPQEQQRFNEHLRWLPISHDLLQQKRPTREVIRLRAQVQELLQQMEGLVQVSTSAQPANLVDQTAHKALMGQLLDGVFEPRRPPTVLHDAAQRYWLNERAITVVTLSGMLSESKNNLNAYSELNTYLKLRIEMAESCRVHAPELKSALLHELTSAQSWLEAGLAKPQSLMADEMKKETTPSILREAAGVSK